jgi:RNA polymerase sigma-70 factor (ECF subfamily)
MNDEAKPTPNPSPITDADPIDREDMISLMGGESAALDRLMDRHGPGLIRFLRRMVGSDSDAADLAQESFVRVFQNRDRFDSSRCFATWLFTIGANLARNHLRARGRTPAHESVDETDPHTGRTREIPSDAPEPDDTLVDDEIRALVRQAVDELPEEMRSAVLLVDVEDHSVRQTSEILGVPARTVESRLYHGRRALRARLSRWLVFRRTSACPAR